MAKRVEEHAFSVEMNSVGCVKRMSFLDKEADRFSFEGFLGRLHSVSLIEGLMLEIIGANGVLRVDITQNEIAGCLNASKNELNGGQ